MTTNKQYKAPPECFIPSGHMLGDNPNRDLAASLPESCYGVLRSENRIVKIKRGETGYWPTDMTFDDITLADDEADRMNAKLGIDPAVRMAMESGSMFGWHIKGADPETYRANEHVKARIKRFMPEVDAVTEFNTLCSNMRDAEIWRRNVLRRAEQFVQKHCGFKFDDAVIVRMHGDEFPARITKISFDLESRLPYNAVYFVRPTNKDFKILRHRSDVVIVSGTLRKVVAS